MLCKQKQLLTVKESTAKQNKFSNRTELHLITLV